jgi:feruloyl-CoA synthase
MTPDPEVEDLLPPPQGYETHIDPVFGTLSYRTPQPKIRQQGEVLYLQQAFDLPDYPDSVIDYLFKAASDYPNRLAIAERGENGWDGPSFAQLREDCEAIAQALLNRGLVPGDCVAILSRNSILHAEMTFGAMMAGLVVAPISPSYARFSEAFGRLESTFAQAQAKVFFVDDAQGLADPLGKLDLTGCEVVSEHPRPGDTDIRTLLTTQVTPDVAKAHAAVTPDSLGKLLFTSGSTGSPKGVLNTHRMMCSNLAMSEAVAMHVPHEHRRKLCWLPWHHTFGGNFILHDTLRTASTLYIDSGRPVAGEDFRRTSDAIREVRPTNYSNVPLAYGMIVEEMENDPTFAEAFFSSLTFVHYGGAGFPGETYTRLQDLAIKHRGSKIPVTGGFAMTELAPSALSIHWPHDGVGHVGMPLPGVEAKLLPLGDDRFELRIKGPNVFPGYINQPALNKDAFDEEGFFRTGDAMRFNGIDTIVDDLRYAGRVSEDFKLDSGTFVQVGAIRLGFNQECGGLVRDAVIAGEGHPYIGALVWLTDTARARAVRRENGLIEPAPEDLAILRDALAEWNRVNHGSSRQIKVIAVLAAPPDLSANEINDKGYINQRQVLKLRADIVDMLYHGSASDLLIRAV